MKNYLNDNFSFWNREYFSPNVESFVFRLYPNLLKKYLYKKRNLILDYGCGQGASLMHFYNEYKFEPYGIDISKNSLAKCKEKMPKFKKNFKLIDVKPKKNLNFFKKKFDVVIAIQSLYYLSPKHLKIVLNNINNNLNDNGLVFFTMISTKHEYWKSFTKKNTSSFKSVNLSSSKIYVNRYKQKTYNHFINFTKSKNDIIKKFDIFESLNIGEYSISLNKTGSNGHHYTFFGRKRKN